MSTAATAVVVGFVAGYLIMGAAIALATVGRPRRALSAGQSIALATVRVALAVALLTAVTW